MKLTAQSLYLESDLWGKWLQRPSIVSITFLDDTIIIAGSGDGFSVNAYGSGFVRIRAPLYTALSGLPIELSARGCTFFCHRVVVGKGLVSNFPLAVGLTKQGRRSPRFQTGL